MVGASALGFCPIHKIDKMSVGSTDFNAEAVCVKCKAAAEPKLGRTQIVEDPGEAYFTKGAGSQAKITLLENQDAPEAGIAGNKQRVQTAPVSLEQIVETAVADIKRLPMPADIKEFKRVQKVMKLLVGLVEKDNG